MCRPRGADLAWQPMHGLDASLPPSLFPLSTSLFPLPRSPSHTYAHTWRWRRQWRWRPVEIRESMTRNHSTHTRSRMEALPPPSLLAFTFYPDPTEMKSILSIYLGLHSSSPLRVYRCDRYTRRLLLFFFFFFSFLSRMSCVGVPWVG